MKVQWHVACAVGFVVAGAPVAAICTLLPDLPWVWEEWKYRRSRAFLHAKEQQTLWWHTWMRGRAYDPPSWALRMYRCTHSLLALPLLYAVVPTRTAALLVVLGWGVHLVLDSFSHAGAMGWRPLYPLLPETRFPWTASWAREGEERGRVAHIVLLSGGWESALCLALASRECARTGAELFAVHFQYGQENAHLELSASRRLARRFTARLRILRARHLDTSAHVVEGRNRFFLTDAIAELRKLVGPALRLDVWIGARAPLPLFDAYGDSNVVWARATVRELDRLAHPRLGAALHPKWLVRARCAALGVPRNEVWSSELTINKEQRK